MKKAFVNCRIMPGGVLNVFQDLIQKEEYSQAKIFTLFSDRDTISVGNKELPVELVLPKRVNKIFLKYSRTHVPIFSSIFDYRNLMMFYPLLMRILSKQIRRYQPQEIIISSFAVAKNISVPDITKKLYLHSPMQYIRSHYDEYKHKLTGYKKFLFKLITPVLRKWDKKFTQFSEVKSNSQYTARLAKEIYHIDSEVQYPNIENHFLSVQTNTTPSNYYVYVGRTVKFVKELDKIIHLFNEIGQPLIIMGSGPDEDYLKSIAGDKIIFVGWITDPAEKSLIISNSKGLINITKESFGICTMEALLCGVPVFGFNDGASVELVDSDSGILVPDKNHQTLVSNFQKFSQTKRDREKIQKRARELISD